MPNSSPGIVPDRKKHIGPKGIRRLAAGPCPQRTSRESGNTAIFADSILSLHSTGRLGYNDHRSGAHRPGPSPSEFAMRSSRLLIALLLFLAAASFASAQETIQLPQFHYSTVNTTVLVPDQGEVLLG